ncbi:hypothetical protein [Aquimarina sp. 2201CG5-10]|uniref:hypothetical protein n=1 Tax=Aquimarina callyspongiae TaxID=3098150 RepID=UPI002AB43AB4|nr:hypothetical protein [Aquimarina sp. 2201CG5-10]MDY8134279.1 hypothetical protein [Aquimarina sp. 2201CG5-10]
MKRFKRALRRSLLIFLIIMAALIPVPVFLQKKEGKFNDDNIIELVEKKEDDNEDETKFDKDFIS